MDRLIDAVKTGPVSLKDPKIARLIVETLRSGHDRRMCKLDGFVVMSNHVHLLTKPLAPPEAVMKWIKGLSARRANQILRRTGVPLWQRESYDHWVRHAE